MPEDFVTVDFEELKKEVMTGQLERRPYYSDPEENEAFCSAVERLADGHAGAMFVLGQMAGGCEGKFLLVMSLYKILELRGWKGEKLWSVWTDDCGQDNGRLMVAMFAKVE